MKFKTQLIAVNVLLLAFLCVIAVVMYRATTGLIENTGWVTHTSTVISHANALGKTMVDMETGQRGFMLTGNENFLEPFVDGKMAFVQTIEKTMDLVADNPPQVKRLESIRQLKEHWLTSAGEYEINLKRQIDFGTVPPEALVHVLQGKTIDGIPQPDGKKSGKEIMDEIRMILDEFIMVENALMETRTKESTATGNAAKNIALFGSMLAFVLGGGAMIVMRRKLMGQLGADPSALIALSQDIAQGTFSARIEFQETSTTSTDNVATTLNHMAETLQENIEVLQERTEFLRSTQAQLLDFQHQIEGINNSQSVIQFLPDGTILSANPIFLDVMGYTMEEIRNQHHRMFVPEEVRNTASYQEFWQDLAAGKDNGGEFHRLRKDGKSVWLQATYTPIKDPNGTVFKIVKYATNITEQKLHNADFQGQIEGINNSQSVIQFLPDGTILSANPIFLDVMGYTMEEIRNQHHRMFVPEEVRNTASYQEFWQDLAAGKDNGGEFHRLRKDGKSVWLQATYTPIKDPNGTVFKIVKYATNITEQKIRNDSYRAQIATLSRGEYSAEFSATGDQDEIGQALLDLTRTLGQVTTVAESIVRGDFSTRVEVKGPQDVLGNSINLMSQNLSETKEITRRENWLKEGQTLLGNAMRGELSVEELTDRSLSTLAPYLDAQAGVFYVRERGSEELRLCGTYAFDRRKRLNSTIVLGQGIVGQAAKEKKGFILEEVPDDHIRIDTGLGSSPPCSLIVVPIMFQGTVNGVLELASLKSFSDNHKELLDRICESLGIAINLAQNREQLTEALKTAQDQSQALQRQQEEMVTQNEELQKQTDALRNSEMELQVQSEELRATNEELKKKGETLVKQKLEIEENSRRIEQANIDVEKKARELAQASKYKSEFLANMSHELRTPLNSLLILAKTLVDNEDGNLLEEQIESARVIHSSGKDLLKLINDILDLSKVEAGKLSVQLETVSLEDICQRLAGQFAPLAKEKGNTWTIDRASNLPATLVTDQLRVEQILKNLLSNALKFTSGGNVTLHIHLMDSDTRLQHAQLEAESSIVFSVVDTGMGIPSEKQAAIFEAFQQADGSTSRKHGGTGLGLSISRELALMLGGEIQLVSEVGTGSTFSLYLPLDSRDLVGAKPEPPVKTVESRGATSSILRNEAATPIDEARPKTLLIIEDDPTFGCILENYGSKQGYLCTWTCSGQEGLQVALSQNPSAILLDMTLPDVSGEAVLDALKKNPQTQHIPVHVISGRENLGELLTKGAAGYLTKPVDSEVLRETFDRMIPCQGGKDLPQVLLVEDDLVVQQATQTMLEQQGAQVVVVETAEKALVSLKQDGCDLLITDLRLPDMSGLELLRTIKADPESEIPPVIVYTAKDLSREEHQELMEYASSVVLKGGLAAERLLGEVGTFFHQTDPQPAQQQLSRMAGEQAEVHTACVKDRHVLLVDDDFRNVFALSKVLKQAGAIVTIADTGALALEKLEVISCIDVVLMDIMMPEMDGYETTQRIREHAEYQDLPIIMLTAKNMRDEEEKCRAAGANGYLSKPVDFAQLFSIMESSMNTKAGATR